MDQGKLDLPTHKYMIRVFGMRMARTYHRLIIQPDPVIGYRYLPDLHARVASGEHSFEVRTNAQGFRSDFPFDNAPGNNPRILALGDSYLAGDGVRNQDRFSDVLAHRIGVPILNFGLPGSGTDQQLLIQERIAADLQYSALLIAPFVRNLNRNLSPTMLFMEQAASFVLDGHAGSRIEIHKPYFRLDGTTGVLTLQNTPVPPNGIVPVQVAGRAPVLRAWAREVRRVISEVHQRISRVPADPEYMDGGNPGWRLMRALLERMISNAGTRPVIIVPFPRHQHIFLNSRPHYLQRFRELAGGQVTVIDILPALRRAYRTNGRKMLLPDGHFTPEVNRTIADVCEPVVRRCCGTALSSMQRPVGDTPKKVRQLFLSFDSNGASAVVSADGIAEAGAREEWFSRIAGDKGFPWHAVQYCLEKAGIEMQDLQSVMTNGDIATVRRNCSQQLAYQGDVTCEEPLGKVADTGIGPSFSLGEVRSLLDLSGQPYAVLSGCALTEEVVMTLRGGGTVAYFSGRMGLGSSLCLGRSVLRSGQGSPGYHPVNEIDMTKYPLPAALLRHRDCTSLQASPFMGSDGILICSPADALRAFRETESGSLVLEDTFIVTHRESPVQPVGAD